MNPFYQTLADVYESGRLAALAILVESHGSTPQKAGAKMLIFPNGQTEGTIGGGILEQKVIEEAVSLFNQDQKCRLVRFDLREGSEHSLDAVCGGDVSVFMEVIGGMPRLLIVGGGHVGQALARMAVDLPFRVVIYDDRPEFVRADLFPSGVQLICGDFQDAMKRLQPEPQDFLAIMTYGHHHDEDVLFDALQTPAGYIGLVASKKKMVIFRENLLKKGVPAERLHEVHSPIGLPIGGHTPPEIALSILAEIVQIKNR